MTMPGFVRKIIPGIGTTRPPRFDVRTALQEFRDRLNQNSEVLVVMEMPGWKIIRSELQGMIDVQWTMIRELCKDAHRFVDEIQRRNDIVCACEMVLEALESKPEEQKQTANRYEQYQQTMNRENR